jgi:periplasmic protein TonB
MMGMWQASLAGVAAFGLHLAGFAMVPLQQGGAQSAGDGGTAPLSLAATDPGIAAMVAAWDAPPVLADAPIAPQAPLQTALAMAAPAADVAPAMPRTTALTPPVTADVAPDVGEAAAAPVPTVRPKARPVQQAAAEPATDTAEAPVATREPASAGTAGQVAAGTGGETAAGSGGQTDAGGLSDAAEADLRAGWGAAIRAKIERKKRYPAGTTATGTVKLRLTVGADGRLQALAVAGPSGDAALDAAAVKAVQSAGRFARAPDGVSGAANFTLNVTFSR